MAQMVSAGVRKLPEIRSDHLYLQHIWKVGNHVLQLTRKYEVNRSKIKYTFTHLCFALFTNTISWRTCTIQPEIPQHSTRREFPVRLWAFTLGKVVGFVLHCPHIRWRLRIKPQNGLSYNSNPRLLSSKHFHHMEAEQTAAASTRPCLTLESSTRFIFTGGSESVRHLGDHNDAQCRVGGSPKRHACMF